MGRRSINTTKSGKYMNPTDQARKEARKRELKKNKKQRQMVRAAVLKGKDPLQILSDMEKIDEMEYSVISPPLLNEKVLKDKRKKLKETWDRVMRLYSKEDRERYLELKKLEIEYETKRSELMRYFDSVRVTQQVQVDEIPLPSTPNMPCFLTSQIPLPNELDLPSDLYPTPHSILKKGSTYFRREPYSSLNQPPGVPPGPPPDLSSDEEEVDDDGTPMDVDVEASKNVENKSKSRKIRFADEDANGADNNDNNDDDDDDDNGEQTGVDTNEEPNEKSADASVDELAGAESVDTSLIPNPEDIPVPPLNQVPLPAGPPPRMPQGPPPMMFRPPPLRPGMPPPPRLLPPGVPPPPPGRPAIPPPGLPIRLGAPPIRLPPGPPPGIPPLRLIRPPPSIPPPRLPTGLSQVTSQLQAASAVLSAPPSLMQKPKNIALTEEETKRAATIEAKPQIRNLSADVMRFMPTTLRVKREDRHKKGTGKTGVSYELSKDSYPMATPVSNPSASVPTKDDAYQQFLLEMEEFL